VQELLLEGGVHALEHRAGPGRLSLDLMGRAVFGAALIKKHQPRSVRCLALRGEDDPELNPLLAPFPHVEVVGEAGMARTVTQASQERASDKDSG
jgi:hypothetical protein